MPLRSFNIELKPITKKTKFKVGDRLLIGGYISVKYYTVKQIKTIYNGEIEIILDRKKNIYLNLNSYFRNESWAGVVYLVKLTHTLHFANCKLQTLKSDKKVDKI